MSADTFCADDLRTFRAAIKQRNAAFRSVRVKCETQDVALSWEISSSRQRIETQFTSDSGASATILVYSEGKTFRFWDPGREDQDRVLSIWHRAADSPSTIMNPLESVLCLFFRYANMGVDEFVDQDGWQVGEVNGALHTYLYSGLVSPGKQCDYTITCDASSGWIPVRLEWTYSGQYQNGTRAVTTSMRVIEKQIVPFGESRIAVPKLAVLQTHLGDLPDSEPLRVAIPECEFPTVIATDRFHLEVPDGSLVREFRSSTTPPKEYYAGGKKIEKEILAKQAKMASQLVAQQHSVAVKAAIPDSSESFRIGAWLIALILISAAIYVYRQSQS